jgi:hypothetical protein
MVNRHVEHFKTHKPETFLFHYPPIPGEKSARIGRYYVELPNDLPMKMRSQLLREIEKAVDETVKEGSHGIDGGVVANRTPG